jgi:hypothetical protein
MSAESSHDRKLSATASSGGDGDPFPPSLTSQKVQSGKHLGVAQYDAYQAMDTVFLTASGGAPINAIVTIEQSLSAVFPPMFALFFLLPDGKILEQKSFVVQRTFHASEKVATVRVKDGDGWHDVEVEQRTTISSGSDHGNPVRGGDMGNAGQA